MPSRRRFLLQAVGSTGLAGLAGPLSRAPWCAPTDGGVDVPKQIKSFCIDFNWVHLEPRPGSPNSAEEMFAPPGHWADASPQEHVAWYEALGANTIQTFAVSCNGYAWYKGGFVPPQPGLKHDFLPEVVRLGHQKKMLVMGYFCSRSQFQVGARPSRFELWHAFHSAHSLHG